VIKSHVLGPRVGKSTVYWKKIMQQRSQFYADCAGTSNLSYLTLYDAIHYNDVISALGSYVFSRNMHFIGVQFLMNFSVYHMDLQNFLKAFRTIIYVHYDGDDDFRRKPKLFINKKQQQLQPLLGYYCTSATTMHYTNICRSMMTWYGDIFVVSTVVCTPQSVWAAAEWCFVATATDVI